MPQDFFDDFVGFDLLGLGFKREDQSVTKNIVSDRFDIFGRHVTATANERMRLRGADQADRRPRTSADTNQILDRAQAVLLRLGEWP